MALFFAGFCIGSGSYGVVLWWHATHECAEVSENFDLSEPSEHLITLNDKPPFEYAPDQPKTIELSRIGVSGYIQKIGLRGNSEIGVPSNISVAGWYSGSVKPGDKGISIIDGHLQGSYRPGIFEHLDQMMPGDTIKITFGDDSSKSFEVVRVKSYPRAKASAMLLSHDPAISRQLNLITCGGEYQEDNKEYAERVLVVAKARD